MAGTVAGSGFSRRRPAGFEPEPGGTPGGQPFSPDRVAPLKDLIGLKVDQVCIGSCSNSSYELLNAVARLLKGKRLAPRLNC